MEKEEFKYDDLLWTIMCMCKFTKEMFPYQICSCGKLFKSVDSAKRAENSFLLFISLLIFVLKKLYNSKERI